MALPRELALDQAQIEDMLMHDWNVRIATTDAAGNINLTPMWFTWAGGRIFIYGRGQKVVNLRRNPKCTLLVDRNTRFPELQGIMMRGTARVLESAAEEAAEPDLEQARRQMGIKYNGGHGQPPVDEPPPSAATAAGRNRRWLVFTPERTVTWDNFKLDRLRRPE
jgi:nitroimidazol reductase NimA-like FMN-containing flavoprotein (pyridoxamine 5'-phosphate oxidase superfamily)